MFSDLRPVEAGAAAAGASAFFAGAASAFLAGAGDVALGCLDLFSRLVMTTAIISWFEVGKVAPLLKSFTVSHCSFTFSMLRLLTSY